MKDIKYEYKIGEIIEWNDPTSFDKFIESKLLKDGDQNINPCDDQYESNLFKNPDGYTIDEYGLHSDSIEYPYSDEVEFGNIICNYKYPSYIMHTTSEKSYIYKIENKTKREKTYYGVSGTFKKFEKKSNFFWKYGDLFYTDYPNEDGRRIEEGYRCKKNPLTYPIDRSKPLKFKTFDELVLEKSKKTNITVDIILQHKSEEIKSELKDINLKISKINDGIFLWKNVIGYIVITKLGRYSFTYFDSNIEVQTNDRSKYLDSENGYINIFDKRDSKNNKSIYKNLCDYTKINNEYIFDFGKIPNKYIQNEFCYKINGIIYRSKDYKN